MPRPPRTMRRMPERPDASASVALPTKAAVLAFIAETPGKVGKREIARAFGIKESGDKIALKRLLRELQGTGDVEHREKSFRRPGTLADVVVADVTGRDRDGELLAVPAEWDAQAQGPAPLIRAVTPRRSREGGHAPAGVNDRVLLRIEKRLEGENAAYEGRVIKLLSSRKDWQIGVFRALPDGSGRLMPVDKKGQGREMLIPPGGLNGAKDGDLVSAEISREGRFGLKEARVRERLGSLKSERAVSLIAIHTHGIPNEFKPETLAAAADAEPSGIEGREDWRQLPLVTIDPVDAKDHDDAVHAIPDPDPANAGGFVLTIAIADVAAYVRPGSALDREALERGNSVYFPDRVVPMLPERISNDLCSLRADEDRPALAFRVTIDNQGVKLAQSLHRVMMRSVAKLAYLDAQNAIDGKGTALTNPLLEPVLRPLWQAYAALRIARAAREPLDLDLPERKLVLNPDGTVRDVVTPERLDAHRLIEEFMILANVCAAEMLEKLKAPVMYRVHDAPSIEKMNALREFLETLNVSLPKAGNVRPALFNRFLAKVAETDNALLVNEVVLRSQAQAEYSPENYGHFGLNLRRYAHFTSPIRRYADLIVHRSLIRALQLGNDGLPSSMTPEALRDIGQKISVAERRAMAAERETADRLIAHFLADKVGASFTGRIAGVTSAGLFIKLTETGADGFVPVSTLGNDYFAFDDVQSALIGARTSEAFQLGDTVSVKLVEAVPVAGALRFEMLSEGRALKASQGWRNRKRLSGKTGGSKRDFADAVRAGKRGLRKR